MIFKATSDTGSEAEGENSQDDMNGQENEDAEMSITNSVVENQEEAPQTFRPPVKAFPMPPMNKNFDQLIQAQRIFQEVS